MSSVLLEVKNIVQPTDFSPASREGLRMALILAEHFDAMLHLVHVVSPVPSIPAASAPTGFHLTTVLKELEEIAGNSLADLVAKEVPAGVVTEGKVLVGDAALEIVRFAAELKAELIVMATHGQTGWRRFISGSVTEKVVRHATVPLLTVRPPDEEGDQEAER